MTAAFAVTSWKDVYLWAFVSSPSGAPLSVPLDDSGQVPGEIVSLALFFHVAHGGPVSDYKGREAVFAIDLNVDVV